MVVPKTHDKDHSFIHSLAHLFETSLSLEIIIILEDSLGILTHLISDGIVLLAKVREDCVWVFNNLSVLDEDSLDLSKISVGGAI